MQSGRAGLDDMAPSASRPRVTSAPTGYGLGFFLSYLSVFTQPTATMPLTTIPEGAPGHLEAELPASIGLAGYLVGTALIVVPLLLVRRRGPLPTGAVAIVVAFVAVPAAALSEMQWAVPAIAAVVGSLALAGYLLAALTRPVPAGASS